MSADDGDSDSAGREVHQQRVCKGHLHGLHSQLPQRQLAHASRLCGPEQNSLLNVQLLIIGSVYITNIFFIFLVKNDTVGPVIIEFR